MSEGRTAYAVPRSRVADADNDPPRGSVVTHDSTVGLYCGPYLTLPGWGSILPEIHPGEFDPSRERIVRIDALVVVEPPPGIALQMAEPDW